MVDFFGRTLNFSIFRTWKSLVIVFLLKKTGNVYQLMLIILVCSIKPHRVWSFLWHINRSTYNLSIFRCFFLRKDKGHILCQRVSIFCFSNLYIVTDIFSYKPFIICRMLLTPTSTFDLRCPYMYIPMLMLTYNVK